jgi:hypothetical protein
MEEIEKLRRLLRVALLPIFGFALLNAVICWSCAWIFYDRYEFSATFLGFGCGGIVVALCSYLYVLTAYTHKPRTAAR